MIHVILTILKILGIVLLAILLLAIVLLSVILFAPVRYVIKADYHDKAYACVSASWLLKLVRFKLVYDEQGLRYSLRLLFISLMDSEADDEDKPPKKEKKPKEDRKSKKEKRPKKEKKSKEDNNKDTKFPKDSKPKEAKSEGRDGFGSASDDNADSNDVSNNTVYNDTASESGFDDIDNAEDKGSPVVEFFEKLRSGIENAYYKTAEFKEKALQKIADISDFINDEANKEFVRFMKNQLGIVLVHIAPRRYTIRIRFGADSPDVTGKVTGAVSVVMAFLKRDAKKRRGTFEYVPVFDEKALDADAYMKGRVRVSRLLRVAWRVYRNERFKKLVLKK